MRGKESLVTGCAAILEGRAGEVDDHLVLVLGGESARYILVGFEGGKDGYWPRFWAARGLMYAWDELAADAVICATGDHSWRVREMAAKVIARHRVADAYFAVDRLRGDGVPRVRVAAERAITVLTADGCP
jgi:hypothetical protein